MDTDRDNRYLDIILKPIRICASYRPKMGHSSQGGMSLQEFQNLYKEDNFYSWFGLDHPLMYAAHKAAGGMTSIYRQIGIGCEHLFRAILQDELGLEEKESAWSYLIVGTNKKKRRLSLDGRIPLESIRFTQRKSRIKKWMEEASVMLDVKPRIARMLQGVVFEVRQGYKSKDSKRQNADIANAATAYTQAYLPCVVVMSRQIDDDILTRYHGEKWVILTGRLGDASPLSSTYSFFREIIGYDLAGFFDRHAGVLRTEVTRVLEILIKPE